MLLPSVHVSSAVISAVRSDVRNHPDVLGGSVISTWPMGSRGFMNKSLAPGTQPGVEFVPCVRRRRWWRLWLLVVVVVVVAMTLAVFVVLTVLVLALVVVVVMMMMDVWW
jgi:hypothetical protein